MVDAALHLVGVSWPLEQVLSSPMAAVGDAVHEAVGHPTVCTKLWLYVTLPTVPLPRCSAAVPLPASLEAMTAVALCCCDAVIPATAERATLHHPSMLLQSCHAADRLCGAAKHSL